MSFEAYRAAVSNTGTDNTYEELFNRAAVAAAAYRGTLRDRPVGKREHAPLTALFPEVKDG